MKVSRNCYSSRATFYQARSQNSREASLIFPIFRVLLSVRLLLLRLFDQLANLIPEATDALVKGGGNG